MYYVWRNTERALCPELTDYTRLDTDDIAAFYYTKGGLPLSRSLPEITFQIDTFEGLYQRDSLWGGMPYLVFSPKLRNALATAGATNIEYYPAYIKNRSTGDTISDYKIANIVGLVFCMDWEHSSYTHHPRLHDRVKEIAHLVLDSAKIPKHLRLFRLGERRTVILCDQQVRDVLTEQEVTGVQFVEVEVSSTDG